MKSILLILVMCSLLLISCQKKNTVSSDSGSREQTYKYTIYCQGGKFGTDHYEWDTYHPGCIKSDKIIVCVNFSIEGN